MCNIVVINKGEIEISTPKEFYKHFGFMPDTDVYLGKIGMDDCLCNCDIEDTLNHQKIPFKKECGDIYVGLLDEIIGDDD